MSLQVKDRSSSTNFYQSTEEMKPKKVNVNDLMARLHSDQKKEKNNNLILSAAAISAVAIFGIILTL